MKKKLFALLIFVFAICLVGCKEETEQKIKTESGNTSKTNNPTEIIDVDPFVDFDYNYSILSIEELTLPESFQGKDFVYETNSKDISINGNKIKPREDFEGKAFVSVKWEDKTKEIEINVNAYNPLIRSEYSPKVNEIFTLEFTQEEGMNIEIIHDEKVFDKIDNHNFIPKKAGEFEITLKVNGVSYIATIIVSNNYDFTIEDFALFVEEEVELPINIIEGDISEVSISSMDPVIEINGLKIKGVSEGVAALTVTLGDKVSVVEVNVTELEIVVLNESFEVDYFGTLELQIEYPVFLHEELVFTVSDESVLKVIDGVCYPNKIGKTRIKITLAEHTDIAKSIIVSVTVDPVTIMKSFMLESAKMIKVVKTYGSTVMEQSLIGSVSKYYFGDLNLIEKIVPLSTNEYAGMTANEELLTKLDETGLIRTGILHTETKYITYHDTANNTAGADAENHWKYLVGDYNKNNRARSWHYTVDDKCVIQNIPDDEVTWQGDSYYAYSQSIGIETCINYGINLDIVWHRMGKLCSKLMLKYNMDMNSIYQHNHWCGKDCPHTLRANNLFSYALDMIEAEWIVGKCLSGYNITFESLTPEYLSNDGQIKRAPEINTIVSYRITITNAKGYNETIEGSSLVTPLS